ncbi:Zinc finger C2H2-type [Fusarium oxysporum f. sp. vasinfectum]|nr:Zinc finger C2H2-type [Fusarium oxysporum f. sp. vasinfectum]
MSTTQPGMFQCGSCKKNYKRLDHLARHVRSHTQTKPYKCHVCPKAFTRPDLLKRHVAGHGSQAGDSSVAEQPRYMPGRVGKACKACSTNHLRCSDEKPCRRCQEKGIECKWNDSMELDSDFQSEEQQQQDEAIFSQDDGSSSMAAFPDHNSIGSTSASSVMEQPSLDMLTPQTSHSLFQNLDPSMNANIDPLFFPLPDLNLLSGGWANPNANDVDMYTYNELDDIDLRFLDSYNTSIPFEVRSIQPTPRGAQTPRAASHTDPGEPAAMCTEAFQNSHWKFRPNAKDHAGAEEHNLSLPATDSAYPSPESVVVQIICQKPWRPFPSAELLDTLLQYYLTSPVTHATSFIHAASFNPNQKRPELVAAMAACGAVLTSDPALSKLGYAIQECLRIAVAKHLTQAFVITLEMGIWSGLPRKVEIAESFFNPVLTMMRRDGKFKRSVYSQSKTMQSPGLVSREDWLQWVEDESFKRLALRMLSHDANTSTALLVSPSVSYAEVLLPFPEHADLWTAASPEQWNSLKSSRQQNEPLFVADVIDDPDILNNHTDSVDSYVAILAVLSCTWTMCWEYLQLSSLQRSRPRRWNTLVTEMRKDELLKLLGHLKLSLSVDSSADPEIQMRLELALLHLQMPFEDIQIFAGMEGPERARAVYPTVRDWVKSEAARHTIFHAAQIMHIAKHSPRGSMRGPMAIILYHASLAFWVYGLLSDQSSLSRALGQNVYLDEADSIALQRFKGFGQGQPCIRWRTEIQGEGEVVISVPLSQPDKVMEAVMGIVRSNFAGMPVPHLTEKLVQLMAELENSAKRKLDA